MWGDRQISYSTGKIKQRRVKGREERDTIEPSPSDCFLPLDLGFSYARTKRKDKEGRAHSPLRSVALNRLESRRAGLVFCTFVREAGVRYAGNELHLYIICRQEHWGLERLERRPSRIRVGCRRKVDGTVDVDPSTLRGGDGCSRRELGPIRYPKRTKSEGGGLN
jgi:hypothetical protein